MTTPLDTAFDPAISAWATEHPEQTWAQRWVEVTA